MLKKNLIYSLVSGSFLILTTISSEAATFGDASFVDSFDDGIVDTSRYQGLGNTTLTESNGFMEANLDTIGDGISMSFSGDKNWFGIEYEAIGFQTDQVLTFNVFEIFNSQQILSLQVDLIQTNSTEIIIKTFDENGDLVQQLPPITSNRDVDGQKRIELDWETNPDGTMDWIIDYRDEGIPEPIFKGIIRGFNMPDSTLPNEKRIEITLNGPANIDPTLLIDRVSADEEPAHTPEPTSTLGLLSLGILGAGATLKRKVKRSDSIEKEPTNIG